MAAKPVSGLPQASGPAKLIRLVLPNRRASQLAAETLLQEVRVIPEAASKAAALGAVSWAK